ALPKEEQGKAELMLSSMSNNFESLGEQVMATGLFAQVIPFDEKREEFSPELKKYREEGGNFAKNLFHRIRFTRLYAKLEETYIPVDLRAYKDIYVFCDSDPIGYYLNQKHIYYHGVEDGLNCLVHFDVARYDNRGHFKLKAFLSKRLNLIFVQNGYGKYCRDMEVNDISAIEAPCPYYIELPRKQLTERLTTEDKQILIRIFVRNLERLQREMEASKDLKNKVLILTDPLCDLETRRRIFSDIIETYSVQDGEKTQIFIKPHPRDELDYEKYFSQYPIFDGTVPMELLNFFPGLHFQKAVTVFTDLKGIAFADEVIRLGDAFMDKYEDPEIHNQNARAGLKVSAPEKIQLNKE
ncbi:MAG: glycosyltransferase family 52 protein, partial [Lachnospiraceae bacterium]|nr:glycosyltransferase family 52 protein [Lachnospiraceae bacterium]